MIVALKVLAVMFIVCAGLTAFALARVNTIASRWEEKHNND
jgi:hypothetical protein